jgi:fructan beta-fructosidase
MTEKFRPNLHFSPRRGWMNDPNGMIRVDGVWHLFYQHDPDSTVHGPMHWGHATSTDLVHWNEQPVALYPDALGTCFSGSAIETDEGVKLFYTAHSRTADGQDYQVQCLVHADDGLSRFVGDAANPVVPNPGLTAFRDPKVIWHQASGKWIMLVTEGQRVGFYGSTDLRDWTYLSSFGEAHGRHSEGPWECPDMVPLIAPNGETAWVLIIGLNPGGYALGSGTQYFLGQFDGMHFTNANPPETELWLDYGRDYYAAQTFFERGGTETPIAIAWASNWLYARQTGTTAFRGVMSLPRELRLVDTPDGLRVAARAPSSALAGFDTRTLVGTSRVSRVTDLAPGEQLAIHLFGEGQPQFIVRRESLERGSIRTIRQDVDGMDGFGHDYAVDLPWPPNGKLDLTLFIDRGLVELSAADGLVWVTNLFFPADLEAPAVIRSMEEADA